MQTLGVVGMVAVVAAAVIVMEREEVEAVPRSKKQQSCCLVLYKLNVQRACIPRLACESD